MLLFVVLRLHWKSHRIINYWWHSTVFLDDWLIFQLKFVEIIHHLIRVASVFRMPNSTFKVLKVTANVESLTLVQILEVICVLGLSCQVWLWIDLLNFILRVFWFIKYLLILIWLILHLFWRIRLLFYNHLFSKVFKSKLSKDLTSLANVLIYNLKRYQLIFHGQLWVLTIDFINLLLV